MARKVMIIDDDKELLEELGEFLSLNNYEVTIVNDSTLAVDMVAKTKPDVILLDLKMPKKNGFDIALELKNSKKLSSIPIIAITGFFKDKKYIPTINICDIQHQLIKPLNPVDVINKIEEICKKDK